MKNEILIAPSVLSADFKNLESEIKKIEEAGADMVHIDVMDGHFVKNITFGECVIKAIKETTSLFLDVHLMIENPYEYIEYFSNAGADGITFHVESKSDIDKTIKKIKSFKKSPALSISPNTKIEEVIPYMNDIDMVLIMTVNPGFGGQEIIKETIDKVKELSKMYKDKKIEVDGGINDKTVNLVKEAGANVIVAGSYIFKSKNIKDAIMSLR